MLVETQQSLHFGMLPTDHISEAKLIGSKLTTSGETKSGVPVMIMFTYMVPLNLKIDFILECTLRIEFYVNDSSI